MRKTWALVMAAAAMAAASLTACSSSKPAETAAPETEAETAETEETEAEATGDQQEILVAAAASLQYVMEDKIQPAFEKRESGHQAELYFFDSSGKLQTQIEEGADADVFFSAAMKQMNALGGRGTG